MGEITRLREYHPWAVTFTKVMPGNRKISQPRNAAHIKEYMEAVEEDAPSVTDEKVPVKAVPVERGDAHIHFVENSNTMKRHLRKTGTKPSILGNLFSRWF